MTVDQLLIIIGLPWLGMVVCVIGLCYVAAHVADDRQPEDTDPEMSTEAYVPVAALFDVEAGLARIERELDEDLTVCRSLWPDAPAWPDTYTPAGEDSTS